VKLSLEAARLLAAWAVLIAVAAGLTWLRDYGVVLFAVLPLLMGALVQRTRPAPTAQIARWQGGVTGAAGCLFFIVLGLEGLICVVMALPLAIPLGILGSWMTFRLRTSGTVPHATTLLLLPVALASAGYDASVEPRVYDVTTSIEIAASPEVVWRHVVSYTDMPEPQEWVFRTGIAYPQRVRIEGTGVGATRYCDFSTGPLVEPITVWEPQRHLEFDVAASPAPMVEWSPYGAIHPPHHERYFVSTRGRFLLEALPNGHTRLEGTSWYQHGLEPAPYWRWWSDAIVRRIHLRVLGHIKNLSEA
jgi:hypothetical protein